MRLPLLGRQLLASLVLTSSLAAAQPQTLPPDRVCTRELSAAVPSSAPPAVMAVELLAAMVRLVEPALPALRGGDGPIAAGEDGAEAATFLHRRHLLPSGWTPEAHDAAAWRSMLGGIALRYRAAAPPVRGDDRAAMLDDAAATLAGISRAVRPLAVIATGADDVVVFFAVVWNWTPVPRLIIVRPPPGLALGPGSASVDRAAPVLERMSTCALRFESFVYASELIALPIFVQQGESTMRILGSEPPHSGLPILIPAERVIGAFEFADPALAGLDVVSVAIEGPSIGVGTAIRVLASVRTNLNLEGLLRHMAFP
jgi:hypothetical protein